MSDPATGWTFDDLVFAVRFLIGMNVGIIVVTIILLNLLRDYVKREIGYLRSLVNYVTKYYPEDSR